MKKVVTADYQLATTGLWEGKAGFDYHQALYDFQFSNLQATEGQFASLMEGFQANIKAIGAKAKTQTMPINLIYLMNYQYELSLDSKAFQTFQFTPTPSAVFSRQYMDGNIGNKLGSCVVEPVVSFAPESATISLRWDVVSEYNLNDCDNITGSEMFGYDPDKAIP